MRSGLHSILSMSSQAYCVNNHLLVGNKKNVTLFVDIILSTNCIYVLRTYSACLDLKRLHENTTQTDYRRRQAHGSVLFFQFLLIWLLDFPTPPRMTAVYFSLLGICTPYIRNDYRSWVHIVMSNRERQTAQTMTFPGLPCQAVLSRCKQWGEGGAQGGSRKSLWLIILPQQVST